MTTYKEKYHLKKTEPIKNKQRITYLNYAKEPVKSQKASTLKNVANNRLNLRDRYSNHPSQTQKEENFKKHQNQTQKEQKNENQSSMATVKQRPRSVSIVQKFTPSSQYQPLQYPKKNHIDNLQKMNILHSLQNFFNRIIKPDNGCVCDQPCEWAGKLFKWVDIPQFLVNQHYHELKQKVTQKPDKKESQALKYFQTIEEGQKHKQKQKNFKQIKKDIDRTQSQSETFKNPIFKRRLQNILKCYVVQDIKVGYVQGMNMVLAGILYHVKDEARTYSIFRKLLYSIRSIYLDSFRDCYIHINRIEHLLKTYLFDIYVVLAQFQIQLQMICLPWILSLLTSIVPLQSIHLIYYGFIKQKWSFIYKVCLSIFVYFKDRIKESTQASQVLTLFSTGQQEFKQMDWSDIVKYGQNIQISFNK